MLQIAIWGICIMLVVKAVEMWQRLALTAKPDGNAGAGLTLVGIAIAIVGAVALFVLANGQVTEMPSYPSYGGL